MSNGDPEPSLSPYIIICNGRIAASPNPNSKIIAASQAATNLVSYYGVTLGKKLTGKDTEAISILQHEMMDNMDSWTPEEIDSKVVEMFDLLDALEDKFE